MKTLRNIFWLIVFIVLVVFCTKNASAVVVDLLLTTVETQLYVMMLSALFIGAFFVGFSTFFEHARLKRQLKKMQRQCSDLQNKLKQVEKSQEALPKELPPSAQSASNPE